MEVSVNEYYKVLYGLYKKFISYGCKWKNFEEYVSNYFRCLKKLKYEIGILSIEKDSELYELKIEELKQNSNNIDKKVNLTMETFFKKENCNAESKSTIVSITQKAKKNSEDYLTNFNEEQFEKYGFKNLLLNKNK